MNSRISSTPDVQPSDDGSFSGRIKSGAIQIKTPKQKTDEGSPTGSEPKHGIALFLNAVRRRSHYPLSRVEVRGEPSERLLSLRVKAEDIVTNMHEQS